MWVIRVLDPFAGTGTTSWVAQQLQRDSIAIELDPTNIKLIKNRIGNIQESDLVQKYYKDYIHTENISEIWGHELEVLTTSGQQQIPTLFN